MCSRALFLLHKLPLYSCWAVLYSSFIILYSCCLVLSCDLLVLSRVASCCYSCCLVLCHVVLVLRRVVSCCYSCSLWENCRNHHCNFVKKETPTQVLSCKICEIFKNTFFYRTFPLAASIGQRLVLLYATDHTGRIMFF